MPELPEVETVVRALQRILPGSEITRLELRSPRVFRDSSKPALIRAVEGATVDRITRRGKFILIEFRGGRPVLAIHLRMSGSLVFADAVSREQIPYIRATFHFRDRSPLHFVDVRQFGTFFLLDGSEPDGYNNLGVEPLDRRFTVARLGKLLAEHRTDLKAFLLNQTFITGIGNIYASEALWEARLSPEIQAGELNPKQIERLHHAVRGVLQSAVDQLGTTFSDFMRPDGLPGEYGNKLQVYGRDGESCPRCGTGIQRIAQHGRSTFYCPSCQHPPRSRGGRS